MEKQKKSAVHDLPDDMKKVISGSASLQAHWDGLTELSKNEWICWVITCKQQATRDKHLVRMVEDMNKGKRRPCCWPGCPHRRENAEKWFSEGALKAAKSQMNGEV
jgi:hypothetical protein